MLNRFARLVPLLAFLAACDGAAGERDQAGRHESRPPSVAPPADVRTDIAVRTDSTALQRVDGVAASADTARLIADSALVAGIVRWDGVVAPFAAYHEGRWLPVHQRAFERRIDRAPISSWYYFAPRGSKRIVRGGALVDSLECGMYESWGITTNLDPSSLPWRELFESEEAREWAGESCPISRIGLALSHDSTLIRMVEQDTAGMEARRILELVRPLFDRRETDRIGPFEPDSANPARYWSGHPGTAAERARATLEISDLESSERRRPDDVRLSRFVVTRGYAPVSRNGHQCPVDTSLEGFTVGNEHVVFIGSSVSLRGACSDAPGMQGQSVEPYGLLDLDGRSFLIAVQHDYEWSAPLILEIGGMGLTEVLVGWEQ